MKFELVFIPHPGMGHIRSTVEVAKLLVERDNRLSITVLVLPFLPGDNVGAPAYVAALSAASNDRFRCQVISGTPEPMKLIKNHIPKVRQAVGKLIDDYSNSPDSPDSPRILAGFVVDMFCTSMVGVAKEFGVPCYLFFASSAALIGLIFAIEKLHEKNEYNVSESEYEDSEAVLDIPSLARPFPVKCLPHGLVSKEILPIFINQAKMFKEMKGILVNTVAELESHALQYLNGGTDTQIPPTYSVGPLIHLQNQVEDDILEWLDDQPAKSVVFLCFGSMGGFSEEQAREIAVALDRSGHRFLWTLRRASPQDMEPSVEFTNLEEVLPDGFFDRTKERGKVIGWAPQVAVLAKPAIGGFITHCGWNSVLESLWFGVPTAAWPLYAEQKFNAFKMVEEHGLAVEIRKYWRRDPSKELVTAEEIETGIVCLMKHDTDVRKRMKDMSDKCHVALMDGGSSQIALQKFIQDVVKNSIPV